MPSLPRILVIRRRYLGDVVLLGSLFRNLRLHWPEAHLAALVETVWAPILGLNPDVNQVLELPRGIRAWARFVRQLRAQRFTHVFDIDNTEKTALIAILSGSPFRVALHHGDHPVKLRRFYSHVEYEPAREHETQPITEYYMKALGAAGIPVASREVRLVPNPADVQDWKRFVGAQGRALLVHPGSRSPWRIWPAGCFAAVCDRVQDELGVQVVLVGGPTDQPLLASIRSRARTHILTLDKSPSLPRLAALSQACAVLLCHDSGPMHVAAAVGTPVVALYGSQNPILFQPMGPRHRQVVPSMPCAACVAPGECVPADSYRSQCVRRLTVEEVFGAVKASLAAA